ncbi:MAG TPA: sugar-binding domain-containing protein [Chloroflexota bacterium]
MPPLTGLERIDLGGPWEFALADSPRGAPTLGWRAIQVPGCWEAQGLPRDAEGPAWYRRTVDVPAAWRGRRVLLRCLAASYQTTVWWNGRLAGRHEGMWDAFAVDVTPHVSWGAPNTIALRLLRPGRRLPLRETTVGFLPDVGIPFGGLWQPVSLAATGPCAFAGVAVHPTRRTLGVDALVSGPAGLPSARLVATLLTADGRPVASREVVARPASAGPRGPASVLVGDTPRQARYQARLDLAPDRIAPWEPETPNLYTLLLELRCEGEVSDRWVRRVGFRDIGVRGTRILLNGRPRYLRGVLHWGWYPDLIAPAPSPETVRQELRAIRALGFNMMKLCLFVPPETYLDVADEEGVLIWQELPMWQPRVTPAFRRRAAREFAALASQRSGHPSTVLYTLGCELNAEADAPLLRTLYRSVKRRDPGPLVRDNSGSGLCYGGLPFDFADFDDYHFYVDLPCYQELLDQFAASWRQPRPWLFGEFCDQDTFRDVRELLDQSGRPPWWLSPDPVENPPLRVRSLPVVRQPDALAGHGLQERADEVRAVSIQQAVDYRKHVIETTRACPRIGGYVVTGLRDVPITTPGLFDDRGRWKFPPESFRSFNADTVLVLRWDPARAWVHGGDRAVYHDRYNLWGGAPTRLHLVVAHHGSARGRARVRWTVRPSDGGPPIARGEAAVALAPGAVGEAADVAFTAPSVASPKRLLLDAELLHRGETLATNRWSFWVFPPLLARPPLPHQVVLEDEDGLFPDWQRAALGTSLRLSRPVTLASGWRDVWWRRAEEGERRLVCLAGERAPWPLHRGPFWREAIKLVEPHPAWGDFPHHGAAGFELYGLATDLAIALDERKNLGVSNARPLLRRLDARDFTLRDYLVELCVGRGRLLVTTLRFHGGLGDQPSGLARQVAGQYLLATLLRYLADA